MKRVTRQEKFARELRCPTGFDELEIKFFIRPVNFVANDGMA